MFHRGKFAEAARKFTHVQDCRSGMGGVLNRPLERFPALQSGMAYSCITGSQRCDFRHDLLGGGIIPGRPVTSVYRSFSLRKDSLSQAGSDLPIIPGISFWFKGFPYQLDAPFSVGERAALFCKADAWQKHIGIRSGFGREYVLSYDEFTFFQP